MIYTGSHTLSIFQFLLNAFITNFFALEWLGVELKEMGTEASSQRCLFSLRQGLCFSYVIALILHVQKYEQDKLIRKIEQLSEALDEKNKNVTKKNDQLEKTLEMKDIFIFTFSHELKNALNGLLGNLQLSLEHEGSSQDKQMLQYLSSAKACGEVLKNFVHNVLDTGKIENSSLEATKERKNVIEFFQDIWAICSQLIRNKRLRGYLRISRDVPSILELDSQRMLQILLNLTSNAVKFTERGQVTIQIDWVCSLEGVTQCSQGNQDDLNARVLSEFPPANPQSGVVARCITTRSKKFMCNKDYELNFQKQTFGKDEKLVDYLPVDTQGTLRIQVIDSGCGMTEEQQSLLFQKFSQVNSNAESRKIGTGLGLWICREITKILDGDIQVKSIPRLGSVFEFCIRTKVPALSPPKIILDKTLINTVNRNTKKERTLTNNSFKVLIADDDGFNIELLKNYLQHLGIDYLCAYNGQEEVDLFLQHYREIGAVITDNYMPYKSGLQAAQEILKWLKKQGRPPIPIICISGDAKIEIDKDLGISLLSKPVSLQQIKDKLSLVFEL